MRALIYLTDDDQGMLDSTAFALRSIGYRCQCFRDPLSFLGAVDGLEPGFIITDLRMPAMNGLELRTALLQRSICWPMILMSGETGFDRDQVRDWGFAAFLRKPFSNDELVAALDVCSRNSRSGEA